MNISDYLKEIYEQKSSGITTYSLPKNILNKIIDFKNKQGIKFDCNKSIRGFKDLGDNFVFNCGYGYDTIDKDLLGGTGSGIVRKQFEKFCRGE